MWLLRHKIFLFSFFAALFFLTSCNRNTLYTGIVDIRSGWPKDNAVKFVVPVKDTLSLYNFYIDIRHTTQYRFSNLYLFMETHFPGGKYTRDTLEIMLATVQGKWIGKGWGEIKEDHVLLRHNLRFPLTGNYEFLIWQGMRKDTLKAIKSVGIDIEKVK